MPAPRSLATIITLGSSPLAGLVDRRARVTVIVSDARRSEPRLFLDGVIHAAASGYLVHVPRVRAPRARAGRARAWFGPETRLRSGISPRLVPGISLTLVSSLLPSTVMRTFLRDASSANEPIGRRTRGTLIVPRASQRLFEAGS